MAQEGVRNSGKWGTPARLSTLRHSSTPSTNRLTYIPMGPSSEWSGTNEAALNEKLGAIQTAVEKEERGTLAFDPEKDGMEPPKRPFLLVHALLVGLAMILAVVVEM